MFDWLRKLFVGTPQVETKPEIVEATKPVVVDIPVEAKEENIAKKPTRQPKKPATSRAMQNAKNISKRNNLSK